MDRQPCRRPDKLAAHLRCPDHLDRRFRKPPGFFHGIPDGLPLGHERSQFSTRQAELPVGIILLHDLQCFRN